MSSFLGMVFLLGSSSSPASADIFDILEEEAQIVTIGSGHASSVRESPTSVWVIDERTLRLTPAQSIYDYLRMIPGTMTREEGPAQMETNLRFKGSFPESQVLVLVDGRVVQSDPLGFFDGNFLSPRNIERVEVILGPATTLYGAGAVNGVISITTRSANRNARGVWLALDGGIASGAPGRIGADTLRVGPLAQGFGEYSEGWGSGAVRLSVSGRYQQSLGTEGGDRIPSYQPIYVVQGVADVTQDVGRNKLRLQVFAGHKRDPFVLLDATDTKQLDVATHFIFERTGIAGGDDRLLINAWYRFASINLQAGFTGLAPTPLNLAASSAEVRAQYTLPTFANNTLTLGTQVRGTWNVTTGFSPSGQRQLLASIYAEDTFRPIQPLLLQAGIRVDTRESPETVPLSFLSASPRGSIVWLVNDKHSLRLEYASAFRTPTALERSAIITNPDGIPLLFGDPRLRNERFHSVTLGWTGRFGWLQPRIDAYAIRSIDNISLRLEPKTSDVFDVNGRPIQIVDEPGPYKLPLYYENLPGFWIPGAAAKITADPVPWLRAWLLYSFIPTRIYHTVGAGLEIDWRMLEASAQVYVTDQWTRDDERTYDVSGRVIVNARVGAYVDAGRHFFVGVNTINATDTRWSWYRRPGVEFYTRDSNTGQRNGPRVWASLEYRM